MKIVSNPVSHITRTTLILDGDTYFTDALITGARENENAPVARNDVTIKSITIQSLQKLNYRVLFYAKDAFGIDDLRGYVDMSLPTAGVVEIIGGTTYYVYNVTDIELSIEDLDGSSKLHIQLKNLSITSKNAGAPGKVQLTLVYGVDN